MLIVPRDNQRTPLKSSFFLGSITYSHHPTGGTAKQPFHCPKRRPLITSSIGGYGFGNKKKQSEATPIERVTKDTAHHRIAKKWGLKLQNPQTPPRMGNHSTKAPLCFRARDVKISERSGRIV